MLGEHEKDFEGCPRARGRRRRPAPRSESSRTCAPVRQFFSRDQQCRAGCAASNARFGVSFRRGPPTSTTTGLPAARCAPPSAAHRRRARRARGPAREPSARRAVADRRARGRRTRDGGAAFEGVTMKRDLVGRRGRVRAQRRRDAVHGADRREEVAHLDGRHRRAGVDAVTTLVEASHRAGRGCSVFWPLGFSMAAAALRASGGRWPSAPMACRWRQPRIERVGWRGIFGAPSCFKTLWRNALDRARRRRAPRAALGSGAPARSRGVRYLSGVRHQPASKTTARGRRSYSPQLVIRRRDLRIWLLTR